MVVKRVFRAFRADNSKVDGAKFASASIVFAKHPVSIGKGVGRGEGQGMVEGVVNTTSR